MRIYIIVFYINQISIMFDDQFMNAVGKNDVNAVIKRLQKGININDNNDALEYAICEDYVELAKTLIYHGANINIRNGDLLLIACHCNKNNEIVELLLKEGINYVDNPNILIEDCVYMDDDHALTLLIQYNMVTIDVDTKIYTYDRTEILHIFDACVAFKSKNILQLLIDNYPEIIPRNINKTSVNGKDVKKYKFIKMLINKNIVDIPD